MSMWRSCDIIITPTITSAAAATSLGRIDARGATNIAARNSAPVTRLAKPVRAPSSMPAPDSTKTVLDEDGVAPPTIAPAPSTISAHHPRVRTRHLPTSVVRLREALHSVRTYPPVSISVQLFTEVGRYLAERAPKGRVAVSFSLELSEDVIQVRDWVHEFAATVVRPAAAEWDEREETPWPMIQEAAKFGLYSMELFATQAAEPTGLGMLAVFEEMFWGDAGIALSILATGLAAASLAANGTPEQLGEWLPQMFGTPDDPLLASFCSSEPGAGSDVGAILTRARYDEANDEWVLNGVKTWATNGGIANVHIVVASVHPELGSRGQATFIIPPNTPGFKQGQKFKKHGISASHTAEVILEDVRIPGRLILGGKDKFDEPVARTREGHSAAAQAAMKTFERTRPP